MQNNKDNKKAIALVVLIVLALFIWIPKAGRKKPAGSAQPIASLQQQIPKVTARQLKRSEFTDWGRNPFIWYKEKGEEDISNLRVSGIIWDPPASYAIISGVVVHEQDTIAGKTVKRIEQTRVVLTDGTQDYVLELE